MRVTKEIMLVNPCSFDLALNLAVCLPRFHKPRKQVARTLGRTGGHSPIPGTQTRYHSTIALEHRHDRRVGFA